MSENLPNVFFCFVDCVTQEIIVDEEGMFTYFASEEEAKLSAMKCISQLSVPAVNRFGIAQVYKTVTEFTPDRKLTFLNVHFVCKFNELRH